MSLRDGYLFAMQLLEEETRLVEDLSINNVKPRDIYKHQRRKIRIMCPHLKPYAMDAINFV